MHEFWKGKRVLVTGISGFVGSNVARALVDRGARVTGLVRGLNQKHGDLLSRCNIRTGDICDPLLLRDVIAQNEIDVIYHFAAAAIVRSAAKDPLGTYATNVLGTANLLEAARNVGRCTKIVVASSDKAYGDHDRLPYEESFPLQPKNTYDASKACMDIMSQAFARNYDMPIVVTRCSNVYGPGDHNLSRLVPNTILRYFDGKRPQVYSDILDMEREFVFVDDVVEAYIAIVERDARGSIYNIGGTGPCAVESVIREIYAQMFSASDAPPFGMDVVERDSSFREIRRQCISARRLTDDVGWRHECDLAAGIQRTIVWYAKLISGIVQ